MARLRSVITAVLIAMCWSVVWAGAGVEPKPSTPSVDAGRIIWANGDHTKPRFIPEKILSTAKIAELPLSSSVQDELRDQVADFASGKWKNVCERPLWENTGQGVDPDSMTMAEAANTEPAAFIGQVVAVEPGWGPYGGVAEAGYLQVEEVLVNPDSTATPKVGDIVVILFPGGAVTISGTRICQDRTEGFYSPFVGDRVFAVGHLSRHDCVLFRDMYRFPVVGGEVLAQPYRNLRADQKSMDLRSLRHELAVRPNDRSEKP